MFLAYNKIQYMNGGALQNLRTLQKVYLKGNPCIDENFLNLSQLYRMPEVVTHQCEVTYLAVEEAAKSLQLKNEVEVLQGSLKNSTADSEHYKSEVDSLKLENELLEQKNQILIKERTEEKEKMENLITNLEKITKAEEAKKDKEAKIAEEKRLIDERKAQEATTLKFYKQQKEANETKLDEVEIVDLEKNATEAGK